MNTFENFTIDDWYDYINQLNLKLEETGDSSIEEELRISKEKRDKLHNDQIEAECAKMREKLGIKKMDSPKPKKWIR